MSVVSSQIKITAEMVGVGLALESIKELGEMMIETSVKSDKLSNLLGIAAGTASQSASEFQFLVETTNKLGLEFQSTAEGFAKFQIAANSANLSLKDQKEIFENVAASMAKLGSSSQDTEGVFKALEQMMSKGKVQAEELRGQLGERLPGAFELYAKSMGVTTEKLNDMISKGEVGIDTLAKFAQTLAETYGAGGPSETAQASLNRLSNSWEQMKREFVDTKWVVGVLNSLNSIAEGAIHASERIGILQKTHLDQLKSNQSDYQRWYDAALRNGRTEDAKVWKEKLDNSKTYFTALQQEEDEKNAKASTAHKGSVEMSKETAGIIKGQRNEWEKLKDVQQQLTSDYNKGAISVGQYTQALTRARDETEKRVAAENKRDAAPARASARSASSLAKAAESEANAERKAVEALANDIARIEAQTTNDRIKQIDLRLKAELQAENVRHSEFLKSHGQSEQEEKLHQDKLVMLQKVASTEKEKITKEESKKQSEENYRKLKMISDLEVNASKSWAQLEGNKVTIIRANAKAEIQAVDEKYKQLKERYGDDTKAFATSESQKRAILEKARQDEVRISGSYVEKLTQHYKDSFAAQGSIADQFTTGMKEITIGAVDDIAESMVEMAETGKASWADMGMAIIKQIEMLIAKMLVMYAVQQLVSMVGGGMSGSTQYNSSTGLGQWGPNFGKADGGAFNNGVEFFANGGVVDNPTLFNSSRGLGVMGEAGPEAIMPLSRGADGKLGVRMQGGADSGISIGAINVTLQSKDDETSEEQSTRIAKAVREQLKTLIDTRITNAKRSGNQLNPTQLQTVF